MKALNVDLVHLGVKIPVKLNEALEELARIDRLAKSEVVRRVLVEKLRRRGILHPGAH
jgi:hypothetical protein